jgi:tRNA G46 methylase TrmB
MTLTKKLWPKGAEIFMKSDSDAYVEDEGKEMLEEEPQPSSTHQQEHN